MLTIGMSTTVHRKSPFSPLIEFQFSFLYMVLCFSPPTLMLYDREVGHIKMQHFLPCHLHLIWREKTHSPLCRWILWVSTSFIFRCRWALNSQRLMAYSSIYNVNQTLWIHAITGHKRCRRSCFIHIHLIIFFNCFGLGIILWGKG